MRTLATLLSELGNSELPRLIEMAGSPLLTEQDRKGATGWIFGYLLCLKDLGRITTEEFEAWASEPRRLALAFKPKE